MRWHLANRHHLKLLKLTGLPWRLHEGTHLHNSVAITIHHPYEVDNVPASTAATPGLLSNIEHS
jgi:hypothetical protein